MSPLAVIIRKTMKSYAFYHQFPKVSRHNSTEKKEALPGFRLIPDRASLRSKTNYQPQTAITSTSARTPLGSSLTATQDLAGRLVKYLP